MQHNKQIRCYYKLNGKLNVIDVNSGDITMARWAVIDELKKQKVFPLPTVLALVNK